MRIAVWGFVLLLPALLAADSSHGRNDVFAPYREAIDARLAQMLDRATEPQRPAAGSRVERAEQPAEPASPTLREYANRYWRGREDDLKRALGRLGQIRPVLEGILESEGVPKSLVAVVLVESAADPLALSPKEARGLWQFIPATARQYGLTVDSRRDDRIHVEQATRAAARFLRDLYEQFQDWPLALAAYNAGKGAVERAVQRSGRDDFWSLSSKRLLPEETRNYVPAVLSAMQLFGDTVPTGVRTEPQGISRSERVYAGTGVSN
ncbi:MAG: lytic transglycosylase domain-containing protein [Bryobacterales bacterium]|nr:lytic transglycosylase domain-containing protein [Bryobacterales bacterium]